MKNTTCIVAIFVRPSNRKPRVKDPHPGWISQEATPRSSVYDFQLTRGSDWLSFATDEPRRHKYQLYIPQGRHATAATAAIAAFRASRLVARHPGTSPSSSSPPPPDREPYEEHWIPVLFWPIAPVSDMVYHRITHAHSQRAACLITPASLIREEKKNTLDT